MHAPTLNLGAGGGSSFTGVPRGGGSNPAGGCIKCCVGIAGFGCRTGRCELRWNAGETPVPGCGMVGMGWFTASSPGFTRTGDASLITACVAICGGEASWGGGAQLAAVCIAICGCRMGLLAACVAVWGGVAGAI